MQTKDLPEKIRRSLRRFIESLKDTFKDELVSVVLYGSGASGEFVERVSNLNLLVVLKKAGLADLKKAAPLAAKTARIAPLFLDEKFISSSLDTFPLEFLDMQDNYILLFGRDCLAGRVIDTRNLRFQCEQELKSKLLNLKTAYLACSGNKAAARRVLVKYFTSALHLARCLLRLKGRPAPYNKKELTAELVSAFGLEAEVWAGVAALKNNQIKLSGKGILELLERFSRDLEILADTVDKM